MSDIDTDINEPRSAADFRSVIEQKVAEGKEAVAAEQARTADLERQLAFARAGVDVDSEAGKIFARGYDGDLEVDAIKAAAAPFLGAAAATPDSAAPPAPVTDTPLDPGEAALLGAPDQLTGTPPTTEPAPADPYLEAAKVHEGMIEEGFPSDVALGQAFNGLVNAANSGDRRVILDPRSAAAIPGQ